MFSYQNSLLEYALNQIIFIHIHVFEVSWLELCCVQDFNLFVVDKHY